MPTETITPVREPETPEKDTGWSGGGPGNDEFGGGGGGSGWNPGGASPADVSIAGIWVAILAIVMFFAALTSVWVVLKNSAAYWPSITLPRILYLDSVLLLASSLTLEFSRGALTAGLPKQFKRWLYLTVVLGGLFITGQIIAWRELIVKGVYLSTNPSSSFFYILTAAHGLHLLGGIIVLLAVVFHRREIASGARSRDLLNATAIYWHFMYALWMYILLLLVLRV